ncbi:hypothetical protein GC194_09245 [bacterium]|nr:hypothetical protein [bacterium]
MKKEAIVTAMLFAAVLLGTIVYFMRYSPKQQQAALQSALPSETLVAYKFANDSGQAQLFSENEILTKLLHDEQWKGLQHEFDELKQLLPTENQVENPWQIAVACRVNNQQLGALLLLNGLEFDDIAAAAAKYQWQLEGGNEQIGQIEKDSLKLFFYSYGQVAAVSKYELLLESSLENLKNNHSLIDLPTGNDQESELWINYAVLQWFVPSLSDEVGGKLYHLLQPYKGVGLYKVSATTNDCNLYGTIKSSALNSAFNQHFYGKPEPITTLEMLPEQSAFFVAKMSWNVENNLRSLMLESGVEAQVDSINRSIKQDVLLNICPYFSDEHTFGLVNIFNHHVQHGAFVIAKVADEAALKESFSKLDSTNWSLSADSLPIRKIQKGAFLSMLFGELAEGFTSPYYAFYNGYVVFANEPEVIHTLWRAYQTGKVLSNSLKYGEMADWLKTNCNLVTYINPALAYNIPREILSNDAAAFYNRNIDGLKNIDHVVYQLVKSNDHFYNHIYLKTGVVRNIENTVLFRRSFESDIKAGPFLLTNYHTKEKEVLVVDQSHEAFQLSRSNEVVWQRKLGEPMVGQPFEIDLFKNNKLQYLIATKKNLHLIDRTGNAVSGYPITLSANISGAPMVFDLKGNKDIQDFVPVRGSRIYGFTAKGIPLGVWSPMNLQANPKGAMQYFNKGGQNYFLIGDRQGDIYVWTDKGKKAVEVIKTNTHFATDFTLQFGTQLSDCKLLSVDTAGYLVTARLNGEVRRTAVGSGFTAPHGSWFSFDGTGGKELLVWQNNQVAVFDQALKKLLSFSIPEPIKNVEILLKSANEQIFAVHTVSNKIYLYNLKGELVVEESFESSTANSALYDIDRDGRVELITARGNELIVYKLNDK